MRARKLAGDLQGNLALSFSALRHYFSANRRSRCGHDAQKKVTPAASFCRSQRLGRGCRESILGRPQATAVRRATNGNERKCTRHRSGPMSRRKKPTASLRFGPRLHGGAGRIATLSSCLIRLTKHTRRSGAPTKTAPTPVTCFDHASVFFRKRFLSIQSPTASLNTDFGRPWPLPICLREH